MLASLRYCDVGCGWLFGSKQFIHLDEGSPLLDFLKWHSLRLGVAHGRLNFSCVCLGRVSYLIISGLGLQLNEVAATRLLKVRKVLLANGLWPLLQTLSSFQAISLLANQFPSTTLGELGELLLCGVVAGQSIPRVFVGFMLSLVHIGLCYWYGVLSRVLTEIAGARLVEID